MWGLPGRLLSPAWPGWLRSPWLMSSDFRRTSASVTFSAVLPSATALASGCTAAWVLSTIPAPRRGSASLPCVLRSATRRPGGGREVGGFSGWQRAGQMWAGTHGNVVLRKAGPVLSEALQSVLRVLCEFCRSRSSVWSAIALPVSAARNLPISAHHSFLCHSASVRLCRFPVSPKASQIEMCRTPRPSIVWTKPNLLPSIAPAERLPPFQYCPWPAASPCCVHSGQMPTEYGG